MAQAGLRALGLFPPVRRGLLTSPWREHRARRTIDRAWALHERRINGTPVKRLPPLAGASPLVVSLTSYPPRFGTLALTLKSLLLQTERADAVILWIARGDWDVVPAEVRALEHFGLEIRACDDHRSHNKYVHALAAFPNGRIAICDDDTYYPPHWLAMLAAHDVEREVPCHRIHRIAVERPGRPARYARWEQDSAVGEASPLNFPTGVGGVLLRADRLDPRVRDMDAARALCPTSDDLWLYWMGRLAGTRFVRVGNYEPLVVWSASQHVALWRTNNVGRHANDRSLALMMERYGTEGIFA